MGSFDTGFWKEFFEALYPKHTYYNIESPLLLIDLNYILVGFYIGIIVGLIAIWYRKSHMGKAVRAIIKAEAFSEETAMSPEELGLGGKRTLIRALRRRKFGGLVKCIGVDIEAKKPDYSGERYYIPEEYKYRAEDRYSRRGVGIPIIIFWAIFLIPVFMFLRFLIPELLQMLDNFIGGLK